MENAKANNLNIDYEIGDVFIIVSDDVSRLLLQENFVLGTHISLNLLNLILENKDFFDYTALVFSSNIKDFSIAVTNKKMKTLAKKNLYNAFKQAINSGVLELNDETRERYHILKEMLHIGFYEQCHKDDTFEIKIEGTDYKIEVNKFFSLLRSEPLELASTLRKVPELYGIKKEHFLYALVSYFLKNHLPSSYIFTPIIEKNFDAISKNVYVDINAINKTFERNPLLDKIEVNEELENYIMSGISPNFTLLEKVIYIYLKMCKVFTYDEEFYAARQRGNVALKHQDLKHISQISLTNNSLVCYEFDLLFEYFLSKIGVPSGNQSKNNEYGPGHTNTELRCGKFLILADSITSIFTGDLFGVKLNKSVTGLICMNNNVDTQVEFKESLDRVYDYIKNEELFEYQEVLKDCSLDDLLSQYERFTDNVKEIPITERIAILFEKVNSTRILTGMDIYSYIMMLGKIFFQAEELNSNIRFELIKNNEPKMSDKETMPLGILAVNPVLFSKVYYENSYYIFSSHHGFEPISYYTLNERFQNGTYEYMESNRQTIPGIHVMKEKTK